MRNCEGDRLLMLFSFLLFSAGAIEGLSYDYSATAECLKDPLKPQYQGGIIANAEFNHGLKGWSKFGRGKLEKRVSEAGNNFVVVHSRRNPHDSVSQRIYLQKGRLYTFSAWIQVSEGKAQVDVVIRTGKDDKLVGKVVAESGCWSMLKSGLTAQSSGPAQLYFESNNTNVDMWVDSVSLQPFTKKQWRSHQVESTEKVRKSNVRIQATDAEGKTLGGAKISIKLNKPSFPFGSAINKNILNNNAYQNWFTSRFTVTTFENEMKWDSIENSPGKEDYSVSDAMLNIAKQHGIAVRGHNIFWDDGNYQPWWTRSLSTDQLRAATERRINSVVPKYAGQVIHWDVVNENLHFSYFEDRLGKNFTAVTFQKAHQHDSNAIMFMNEYNTLEESGDKKSGPSAYVRKLKEIQPFLGNDAQMGIGLESHFKKPDIAYMRSAIDTLAATNLPIWLTEVDVTASPNQAQYLEQILREAHSHPAVRGIILWTAWSPNGCYRMCLTDNNFNNLPTGDVVDRLINEWAHKSLVGVTDDKGSFDALLFHGDYEVTITHPLTNSTMAQRFNVPEDSSEETTLHFQIK